jgi:N-acetylneuraminate synthase/N,N'-diacetyllegionaminate synthase
MKNKEIKIRNRKVGNNQPVFIIAEAGVNHNGSLKLAKRMIDSAKNCGVDAVKFQTFKTEEVVTRDAPKAEYQKASAPAESQFEMIKKLELSEPAFRELSDYCRKKKIIFLSTPFDFQSARFLYKLGVPAFKIGSGELTNIPLLLQIAQYGKAVILSTGMSDLKEVKDAVRVIYSTKNKKLILLHCTSNYPAKFEDINLRAMDTLKKKFNVPIGYSDHTKGIEVAIAAVAMGACVIEKHFTLDNNLPGPDHKASITPAELKCMVKSVRNIEKSLGNGIKEIRKSELEIKKVARKSIVASVDIPKGMILSKEMLVIKRPGTGIEPKFLGRIIGKRLKKNILEDKILTWDLLV